MKVRPPRLSVRAIIVHENRLLLVNAYPGHRKRLWCAPGGGVEPGQSLPDNLAREVHEECGLEIAVGDLALVNEFHDPASGFHQVELFFRCRLTGGPPRSDWRDPAAVVTERRFFAEDELHSVRLKPDSLPEVAFAASGPVRYDPLERII